MDKKIIIDWDKVFDNAATGDSFTMRALSEYHNQLTEKFELKPKEQNVENDPYGNEPEIYSYLRGFYVHTRDDDNHMVWAGPTMPTKKEAMEEWNKVMKGCRERAK